MNGKDSQWGKYVKPEMWKLLKVLRLDVKYHRASGDYMYYKNGGGEEVKVLDLAGGMGATILGHNHPEIKLTRLECLENDVPVHAQGSVREDSGLLAAKLNELFPGKEERTVIFTNSGTETIECALKHAEFNRVQRLLEVAKRLHRNCNETREYYRTHPNLKLPRAYQEAGFEALLGDAMAQMLMLKQLRPVVIAAERSFHGKTAASLRITGNPAYREAFSLLSGIDARFVEYNNIADLKKAVENSYTTIHFLEHVDGRLRIRDEKFLNLAAFIMEPVQGEGGVHVATDEYMNGVERLRRKHGFEWMLDEIQTGIGRTGRIFALENFSIDPDSVDYVILSKALGGATNKIGAMMVRSSIHDARFGILHTSTFAEDDESARVGLKTLDVLTRDSSHLLRGVREKGRLLVQHLRDLKRKYPGVIKDVRGLGLLAAIEFTLLEDNSSLFFNRSAAQGVLGSLLAGYLFHEHHIRTAPPLNALVSHKPYNAIRIEPSAYVSKRELEGTVAAIDRACEMISKCNAYQFSKYIVDKETPGRIEEVADYSAPVAAVAPDPAFKNARRMTFLIHPLDEDQVMEGFDPSLHKLGKEVDPETGLNERQRYWNTLVPIMESFVFRNVNVRSPRTGDRVNARFIVFLYTTRQMNIMRKTDPKVVIDGVQKAVDLAAKLGGDIVGLGAFTSIVTHNGTDLDDTFIRITSGNSYTTALIWQSILKAAQYMERDLNKSVGAVVGAGGNIGSVSAGLLSEDVPRLYLVGRSRHGADEDLRAVAETIYSDTIDIIRSSRPETLRGLPAALATDLFLPLAQLNMPQYRFNPAAIDDFIKSNFKQKDLKIANLIKSTFYRRPEADIGAKVFEAVRVKHGRDPYLIQITDIKTALKEADVVVSAVSAHTQIIETSWIKPGAIVNDVSLPPSVSLELYRDRPDVLAIQGGIGHLPEYLDLGIPGLAVGATLGCMAETFILTMMNMIDNYSFGKITRQQVVKIWEAGRILGFGLAAIKYKDHKLTRDIAKKIREK